MVWAEAIRRRGFTLIECLTSIGIVAIIVAMLMPAIFSAREGARRTHCQNNLRQIAVATHSFHTAENALPSLYSGTALRYPLGQWDQFHMHSWRVPLLPFLEQTSLNLEVEWNELATAAANARVAQTAVPTFLCPSGGDPSELVSELKHTSISLPPDQRQDKDYYSVVRSDYDAMAGIQALPDPLPANLIFDSVEFVHWGVWGVPKFDTYRTGGRLVRFRRGRFREVADGLSKTIAIVERGGKPIDLLNGKPNVTPDNPDAFYPGQVGWSASNHFPWAINGNGIGVNESNAVGVYSLHRGGANVAIADGSVRFLSDTTDFHMLVHLIGRSDGGALE